MNQEILRPYEFRATVPRYLTAFHPKHALHRYTDVLIIGGGIAGLRAALEVQPPLTALVVTKDAPTQSSSHWAQGGIAGVLGPDDKFEYHVDDTMRAGGNLCDRAVVEQVVREGPDRIAELIQWGTQFDEEESGDLALGREGGHSHDRIVHALGDATGKEVMRAMGSRFGEQEHLERMRDCFTLDLLVFEGACRGAVVWHRQFGIIMIWAKEVILCTGGVGQLYRESTNPLVATGDGHALAFRAGVELRDMEFMQFHPTMLYIAGSSRSLITEAVRGAGARLVDRDGVRFMAGYDERGELAPRDVVSQAIVSQMEKTRHANVYLDLSHMDAEKVRLRFPGIVSRCTKFGLDAECDRIPVRPGAHYMVGGVTVNLDGRTTLPHLWAAGEVTSSGLHGANRLASNSLLEGLVFGAHAGRAAARAAGDRADQFRPEAIVNPPQERHPEPLDLTDILNSLKSLMWRQVGVRRTREELLDAATTVDGWCRYVLPRQFDSTEGWELQSLLTVARVMIQSALVRIESRGVHFRTDYPEMNAQWDCHLMVRRGSAGMETIGRTDPGEKS